MLDPDFFWDDLLLFIAERSVIPIIGAELLMVDLGEGPVHLFRHWAEHLVKALRLPEKELPKDYSLDQVVYLFLAKGGRRELLYRRLRTVMDSRPWPIPEALMKMARIPAFNLFVTTTFDRQLEEAIQKVRLSDQETVDSLVYTLTDSQDLPVELDQIDRPLIYYLFGRVSSQPDYALTDEDVLEFVHCLQSETRRPNLLFDEFRNHHLLLLGNSHSDWLSRFFIRTVRNERLTLPVDREAVVAGQSVRQDRSLALFLNSPLSYPTMVFEEGNALEFVDELYERWTELYPVEEPREGDREPETVVFSGSEQPEMEVGAIFLSYASDDLHLVEQIRDHIDASGLDVWFDKLRLEGGDDYDLKIRRNIRKASLFCPFISQNTERRLEGYFRREWRYALDRSLNIDESTPFILPIVLDETRMQQARVPEEFKRFHCTRLEQGQLPLDFLERMRTLFREYQKRERGL